MHKRSSKAKRSMKAKRVKRSSKSKKTMRKTRKNKTKKGSIPRLEAALRNAIQKAGGQPTLMGGQPIV